PEHLLGGLRVRVAARPGRRTPGGLLTRTAACAHSFGMRASAPLILAAAILAAPAGAADAPAPALDPDIQAIVDGISADRIQRSIYVLASFKTRHTLSDPAPSGDGIGGAASWIHAEFDRISKESLG